MKIESKMIEGMVRGTVKRFNQEKGFGFFERENGEDVFFHISAMYGVIKVKDVPVFPQEGEAVWFKVEQGKKGPFAERFYLESHVIEYERHLVIMDYLFKGLAEAKKLGIPWQQAIEPIFKSIHQVMGNA